MKIWCTIPWWMDKSEKIRSGYLDFFLTFEAADWQRESSMIHCQITVRVSVKFISDNCPSLRIQCPTSGELMMWTVALIPSSRVPSVCGPPFRVIVDSVPDCVASSLFCGFPWNKTRPQMEKKEEERKRTERVLIHLQVGMVEAGRGSQTLVYSLNTWEPWYSYLIHCTYLMVHI